MTTDNKTCHRIKKFCWRSNPKSPGLSILSFLHFRRTEFTTDGAVNPDRVPASSPEKKNFKLKQRSASRLHLLESSETSKLNKDSQTEFFSQPRVVVSVLSLIQKNLRPVQMCILCAVREELTYISRVCLTKFILCSCRQGSLSSVSGREEFIL